MLTRSAAFGMDMAVGFEDVSHCLGLGFGLGFGLQAMVIS